MEKLKVLSYWNLNMFTHEKPLNLGDLKYYHIGI